MGRYAGLNLVFTAGWTWCLRRVELGVYRWLVVWGRYAGLKLAFTAGWSWRIPPVGRVWRYAGLNLAFTASWSWRIPQVGRVGALRRVEFGVYGGLELA